MVGFCLDVAVVAPRARSNWELLASRANHGAFFSAKVGARTQSRSELGLGLVEPIYQYVGRNDETGTREMRVKP